MKAQGITKDILMSKYATHNLFLVDNIIINLFIFLRPKSVPNSPSFSSRGISRWSSHLRHQISNAWSNASTKNKKSLASTASVGLTGQSHLRAEDKKKWPSAQDCRG